MCVSFKYSLSTNNSYCYTFILGFQLLLCFFSYLFFGISVLNFVYFKSIFHDGEYHLRPILNLHCSCFEHFKSSSLSSVNNPSSVQFSSVTQSCPTLYDPMDCSPPGSFVHEIFQARILEWAAILPSRYLPDQGSSLCLCFSFLAEVFFTTEPPGKPSHI